MLLEISIVVLLIVLNGVLAMSELAVVSSRPARLKVLAEGGSGGARKAIKLAEHPGRFLSTVQIGITLVGVLSGAFSGATLGARLASWLELQGLSPTVADALGVGAVVMAITYLSLIIGELVPKQVALRNPEAVASRVAPAMTLLSTVALPLVWLLDGSGNLVLKLLGQSGRADGTVTDEEIKTILAEAHSAGVIESEESAMITGVMRLADRNARAIMTPRREVEMIDLGDTIEEIRNQVRETTRTRLPVFDGGADEIIGVLYVKDLYAAFEAGKPFDIRTLVREAPIVSDLSDAMQVIEALRKSSVHIVLVFDEYGHFEGIISSGDILESIMGAIQDGPPGEQAVVRRDDGSYLVAGWMPIDEFAAHMNFKIGDDVDFQTVAGLVLEELRRIPSLGESFEKDGWRFEVIDLDGRRIDKVLVTPPQPIGEDGGAI